MSRSSLEKASAKVIGGNKVISALRRKGNILLIRDVHALCVKIYSGSYFLEYIEGSGINALAVAYNYSGA